MPVDPGLFRFHPQLPLSLRPHRSSRRVPQVPGRSPAAGTGDSDSVTRPSVPSGSAVSPSHPHPPAALPHREWKILTGAELGIGQGKRPPQSQMPRSWLQGTPGLPRARRGQGQVPGRPGLGLGTGQARGVARGWHGGGTAWPSFPGLSDTPKTPRGTNATPQAVTTVTTAVPPE